MNQLIFTWLYGLSGHYLWLDGLIRFTAVYLPWLLAGILFWQLLGAVERGAGVRAFVLMALASGVSASVALIIKTAHYRPRPFVLWSSRVTALLPHVPDAAFPSAHAAIFFALALAVWTWRHRWGYYYLLAALIISLARVAAGLHSPLDILGGAVVGVVVSACLIRFFRYNRPHVSA